MDVCDATMNKHQTKVRTLQRLGMYGPHLSLYQHPHLQAMPTWHVNEYIH